MSVRIFKTPLSAIVLVQNFIGECPEFNTIAFGLKEQELIEFKREQKLPYYNSPHQQLTAIYQKIGQSETDFFVRFNCGLPYIKNWPIGDLGKTLTLKIAIGDLTTLCRFKFIVFPEFSNTVGKKKVNAFI